MMIYKLPQIVINQIAAGEVVERPASIVKELVENALDAGATHIVVKVLDGGKQEIIVDDNGSGIAYEDIPLVFAPHATSKIRSIEDLSKLHTLGFRGEALASISAVARVKLVTRHQSSAYQVISEGGVLSTVTPNGRGLPGTQFMIQNLFYNVPARKKFLKSNATELAHISRVIENFSLIHPDKHIELYSQNRLLYDFTPEDFQSRVAQVLAINDSNYLLPLEYLGQDLMIQGQLGHPRIAKKSSQMMRFFINGRPIQSNLITKAVQEGFDTMLEVGHAPIFVGHFNVNPAEVDVNVHPRKIEVKFTDERKIFGHIRQAVRESLKQEAFSVILKPEMYTSHDIQSVTSKSSMIIPKPIAASSYRTVAPDSTQVRESTNPFRSHITQGKNVIDRANSMSNSLSFKSLLQSSPELTHKRFIQLFDTYIVYPNEAGLMILDQHAVHEKILLEQFIHHPDQIRSQALLIPITLQVSESDKQIVLPILQKLPGFESEEFGRREILVRKVPTFLLRFDKMESLLADIIAQCLEHQHIDLAEIRTELYKTIACRSAIKAGKHLSDLEIQSLIDQAVKTDFGFACCHGRPTMVQLDQDWFEKQFGRK